MEKPKELTVLVVEDEKPLQHAIQDKITKEGCSVVTARRVDQAIAYLEDVPKIDVIWLDHYLLGEEDGLDFVVKVKESDKWKDIPIFVVSNTASADKVKTYLKLGVTEYYTKADNRLDDIIAEIKKTVRG